MVYYEYIVQICESIQLDVPGFYSQGGTLIFSYIHARSIFWGQIFEFQYFLGFSEI